MSESGGAPERGDEATESGDDASETGAVEASDPSAAAARPGPDRPPSTFDPDAVPESDEPAPIWAKLLLAAFPLAVVALFMLLEAWIRG